MKVRTVELEGKVQGYAIFCPACKCGHVFDHRWHFNGDLEKPTFTPSLWVDQGGSRSCHSVVTDGMIQFLDDCGHSLKGQTVPLEDF